MILVNLVANCNVFQMFFRLVPMLEFIWALVPMATLQVLQAVFFALKLHSRKLTAGGPQNDALEKVGLL